MILLITLIAIVAFGAYLSTKCDWDMQGILLCIIFGGCLLIHTIAYSIVGYEYRVFVAQRDAFESTLSDARKNNNQYETAAIVKDVALWNQKLAVLKFRNKTVFFDQYVDDRVDALQPIK